MSEFNLRYPASALVGKHRLTADDIVLLRKHMFPRGVVSADDARQLLALHRATSDRCDEWNTWLVETIAAFIVVHSYPQLRLDELNAEWLIALVSTDGAIETFAELELLLHAMEMACDAPGMLSAFVLDQLRIALESKTGAYSTRRDSKRVGVAASDIDFIYRVLRGSMFAGRMVLSVREVAVFDRIHALVRNTVNHPAWYRLVQSIASRTPEGHASAAPWLQMQIDDVCLDEAA